MLSQPVQKYFLNYLSILLAQHQYYSITKSCVFSDPCKSGPCKNGATCTTDSTDYSCACPAGYSGKNCEINDNGEEIRREARIILLIRHTSAQLKKQNSYPRNLLFQMYRSVSY